MVKAKRGKSFASFVFILDFQILLGHLSLMPAPPFHG
jgi:hypothetical protein